MPRRTALLAVALGVTGLLIAAAATFVLSGGGGGGKPGPDRCPQGYGDCIPNLDAVAVNSMLKEHGYRCDKLGPHGWTCALSAGMLTYECYVFTEAGHITELGGAIRALEGVKPGPHATVFLQWIAAIPYAHDPDGAAQVRTWTADKLRDRKHAVAAIGGYTYEMNAESSKDTRLKITPKAQP